MRQTRWKLAAGAAMLLTAVLALAAPVPAAGALSVHISPDRAHTLPGGQVDFTASVRGDDGVTVAADVVWSIVPAGLGSIDSDGRFVAGNASGRAIVRAHATAGRITGIAHAVIDIGAATAKLSIVVEPPEAVIGIDVTQRFTATVTDGATGEDVQADIRWIVVPDRLGTIDASGLFRPSGLEGTGRIAARVVVGGREAVGDAALVVGSPRDADIVIRVTPEQGFVVPGGETVFEALVTNESGDKIDADVSWLVMPARLGVVDDMGTFTAGTDVGVGRVVATVSTREGPVRGLAGVAVERPGPLGLSVRVSPREAAVPLGGDVTFDATATGPDGESLDIPVDWSVRPSWMGAVDEEGLLVVSDEMQEPPVNGAWVGTVTASVETDAGIASDAARVIVRDTGLARRLRIRPSAPVVAPGGDVQFEAVVLGDDAPTVATEWDVVPTRLGTITPDGLFTANPAFGDPASGDFGPHAGVVTARAALPDGSVLTARAHVRVRVTGEPVRIRISPAVALVEPGATVFFNVAVIGPNGSELDLPVTWSVRPQSIGSVSGDGEFTAAQQHGGSPQGQRPRGLVVAEVRIPGGKVFRGSAVVVIDSEQS